MRVVVMGAAGFLGSRLAQALARSGQLAGRAIGELVLFDARPVREPRGAACKLAAVHGDLRSPSVLDALFATPADVVFHLAATLTLDAETDFRRGLETNVLGLIELLERCRRQATAPQLLFASSISTFGGELPPVVDDHAVQAPRSSYGTHKVLAEHLIADYSRHGFVDGRALRLPVVLTHPGPPSGSISDQVAALIREPLRGQRTVCRFAPDTPVVVASVDKVVQGFLHLASLPATSIAAARSFNLPGLAVTPAQLVQAAGEHVAGGAQALVDWQPDERVQAILDGWPRAFTSQRALALGFVPDRSAADLVASFLAAERERG